MDTTSSIKKGAYSIITLQGGCTYGAGMTHVHKNSLKPNQFKKIFDKYPTNMA